MRGKPGREVGPVAGVENNSFSIPEALAGTPGHRVDARVGKPDADACGPGVTPVGLHVAFAVAILRYCPVPGLKYAPRGFIRAHCQTGHYRSEQGRDPLSVLSVSDDSSIEDMHIII
jgi:hypothetical protein